VVGDQIRETFDAQVVLLATFDPDAEQVSLHYCYEKGKRFYPPPFPFNDPHRHLMTTGQVVRIDGGPHRAMARFGLQVVPGTEKPLSQMYLPLGAHGEVTGYVSLQNIDRENAFDDADQRLLSTLASSMSVALENVRLFEETRQRNAELAVINRIQEGLAQELGWKAIIDLVGDTLRDVFGGVSTLIALYDGDTNIVQFPYWIGENDQRIEAAPIELGPGLPSTIIESGQPLVFGTWEEGLDRGGVVVEDGDARNVQSRMGVPIMLGEQVRGVVSVQDYAQHRYGKGDVRLLSTITASMGVALENVRLFKETHRLLEETQQRNAEMACTWRTSA